MISIIFKLSVLIMTLGSCSFGMRGVDPAWDGKQEPVCADSYTPVVLDISAATSLASVAVAAFSFGEKIQTDVLEQMGLGSIIVALLYTASAHNGASKYRKCRLAWAWWHAHEAIKESREPDLKLSSPAAPILSVTSSPQPTSTTSTWQATTTIPHGYYCVTSSERAWVKVCVRERAACEHVRKIFEARGSEACARREIAWCFGIDGKPRCFETQDACKVQLETVTTASSLCTEQP
jgi:hypothetical protein